MKPTIFKRRPNFLNRMSSTASDSERRCKIVSFKAMTQILAYQCKLVGSWRFGHASRPCDQELASSHALSSFAHDSYRKLDTGSPGRYTAQTPFVLQAIAERYFWLLSGLVYHKMPQIVWTVLQQFPNTQGLLIGKREPQFNRRFRDRAHRKSMRMWEGS